MFVPSPTLRAWSAPVRILAIPIVVLFGADALLWMTGFGATPPERLPVPTLVFFGALFGDALAQALRRGGRANFVAAAIGVSAAALLAFEATDPRHMIAPAATLALAGLLAALPERRAEMWGAIGLYTASTLLANYTLDAFLPLGDWFLVNVGTLFFGVTFTQRDRVHRFGRRVVYGMILFAAVANVAVALELGTPLRYVAVGFLAILASETADTEVYGRMLSRRWLTRVASSNAVSAPLDTILFTVLAFAGAPFATLSWMLQVIVTDVIVKYASGFLTALTLLGSRAARTHGVESATAEA